jgi:hypothetical protein
MAVNEAARRERCSQLHQYFSVLFSVRPLPTPRATLHDSNLLCYSYYMTLRSWAVLLSLAFWLLLGVRDVLCWRFLFITAS